MQNQIIPGSKRKDKCFITHSTSDKKKNRGKWVQYEESGKIHNKTYPCRCHLFKYDMTQLNAEEEDGLHSKGPRVGSADWVWESSQNINQYLLILLCHGIVILEKNLLKSTEYDGKE